MRRRTPHPETDPRPLSAACRPCASPPDSGPRPPARPQLTPAVFRRIVDAALPLVQQCLARQAADGGRISACALHDASEAMYRPAVAASGGSVHMAWVLWLIDGLYSHTLRLWREVFPPEAMLVREIAGRAGAHTPRRGYLRRGGAAVVVRWCGTRISPKIRGPESPPSTTTWA